VEGWHGWGRSWPQLRCYYAAHHPPAKRIVTTKLGFQTAYGNDILRHGQVLLPDDQGWASNVEEPIAWLTPSLQHIEEREVVYM